MARVNGRLRGEAASARVALRATAIAPEPAVRPPSRRPVVPSRVGARFDDLLAFEAWRELGGRIATHVSASSWWLGDWLTFGQRKYGRRYKHAVPATGLDYQTLRNYAVVARRFEMSRRRDDLSFQHHAEVCAMSDDEQDLWLQNAAAGRWSRSELRRRIRASRTGAAAADEVLRLVLPVDRLESWREAARRADRGFDAWVVWALDEAAGGASGPGPGVPPPG